MCFKKVFGSFCCSGSQHVEKIETPILSNTTPEQTSQNNYELLQKLNLEDGYTYRHYKKIINRGATTPLKFRCCNLLYLLPMLTLVLIGFTLFLIFLVSTVIYLYESQVHDGSEKDIITAAILFLISMILLVGSCGTVNLWKRSFCVRISFVCYPSEFIRYGPNYSRINGDESFYINSSESVYINGSESLHIV